MTSHLLSPSGNLRGHGAMRDVGPPQADAASSAVLRAHKEEVRRLRQAQRISRVGSWHYRLADAVLVLSDVLSELYGLDSRDLPPGWAALTRQVHADDQKIFVTAMQRLSVHGEPMFARYRVTRASDGKQRWFDARGIAARDTDGTLIELAGTIADVTELVQAEMQLRRAHADLSQAHTYQQAVITATPDVIHIYDVATKVLQRANRSGKPLIGFTDEAVRVMSGIDVDVLLPAADARRLERMFETARCLPDGEVTQLHHALEHADGQTRWLSRRMTPFERDTNGVVTLVLVVSRDVTDVVALEQRLEYAALHDEMTGLPNRRLIRDRIEQALRHTARGGHLAVLICDLDGFKRINDSHGHRSGDGVLLQVARRLQDVTRNGDTVARMGGDEFAVIVDIPQEQDPRTAAEEVAQRISASVAAPIHLDGYEHTVSVSIGICIADDGATAESLISDADAAMYYIKAHGANGHAFFDLRQRPDTAGHNRIERHIRTALATDTVEVYYQPIVNPRTNKVHAVEALVRIHDETGGLLDTSRVIDVAEQTGLITALDERVLELACARVSQWRQQPDHADLMLNVNCSVKDIARPGFYERISRAITDSRLEPRALTLEITETVLLDATEDTLRDLRALAHQGIGLAIDDFGTGYASLRYLAELPISCIKLDRSFTQRLPDDPTSMTLVHGTIGLAERLGISCTVEGVETPEQLKSLSS